MKEKVTYSRRTSAPKIILSKKDEVVGDQHATVKEEAECSGGLSNLNKHSGTHCHAIRSAL